MANMKIQQVPLMTGEQQNLMKRSIGGFGPGYERGLGITSDIAGGSPEYFEQLEAPALRQFSQLQGQLGHRFSGMGTGARRSSGFGLASSSAAQQLAESLQSQRLGLQRQAMQDLMGFASSLLGQRSFENIAQQRKPSTGSQFMSGIGSLAQFLPLLAML